MSDEKVSISPEVWKPIEGYEGLYEVSNMGRVRSLDRVVEDTYRGKIRRRRLKGRVLKPGSLPFGYKTVTLWNRTSTHITTHTLVARAFVDGWQDGLEVNHINSDPADNRADNLEWVTHADNLAHGRLYGNIDGSNGAKLSSDDVRIIRRRLEEGEYQRVIAADYGVQQTAISDINTGKTWSHVQ